MKKLLAIVCCVLYMHSFSQPSTDLGTRSQKASGEKVLIKALAVIVNPDGNKKTPVKTVQITATECP